MAGVASGSPAGVTTQDPLLGQTVGSFKLIRPLGRGGMGTVYLAEHPVIGSKVAIKFLHEALSSQPDLVRRFYDEARAVNLVGHDHIVSIFDLNLLPPNRYYIVMEFLDGQPLADLLTRTPLPLALAGDMLVQLCDTLQAAHQAGVIHRDLKPENIFVVKKGSNTHFIKVLDFGIAKLRLRENDKSRTAADAPLGTPDYMSPEQVDHQPIGAQSDLYSLGVIAFRMVTGRLPFEETNVAKMMVAHLEKPPPSPRLYNPQLSPRWESAILRALEKRPEDRYADMDAFGQAVTEAMEEDWAQSTQVMPVAPLSSPRLAPARAHTGASPAATTLPPQAAPQPSPSQPGLRPAAPPSGPSRAAGPTGITGGAALTPTSTAKVSLRSDVQVQGATGPAVTLPATEITRAGCFIGSTSVLPPLMSRVKLTLSTPALGSFVLQAQVVRHISPSEARSWGMEPGYAVQFVELTPDQRQDAVDWVAHVSTSQTAQRRVRPETTSDAALTNALTQLTTRATGGPYSLLGVQPDADFPEIKLKGKALEAELLGLEGRKPEGSQKAQLAQLREQATAAVRTLSTPSVRLDFDAQRGNFRGVARCLATGGIKDADLAAKHAAYAKERTGLDERIQLHLGRIKLARNRDNTEGALRECELALAQAPLHPELQRSYAALKKKAEGAQP
jgi:serine/threonine-protein kinase